MSNLPVAIKLSHASQRAELPASAGSPPLIAAAGVQPAWSCFDFSPSNIRNSNPRRAYARICQKFFARCEERNHTVATTGPYNVATYIETRSLTHSAPDVKQQLAAVRTQFDWLINGEVVLTNPVAAIRGPQYVVPNPGALEHTQEMAAHESACTTKLCDRTKERLTRDEMERIRL